MVDPVDYVFIVASLAFSAFFSGMEIAFVSSNKLKIELDKKQGIFSAKILSSFLKKPSRFIGAMLVGNNIALVVYGILMAKVLDPVIARYISSNDWIILLSQTIISTIIILVTAEFIPKALFQINPNKSLATFSLILLVIYYFPLIFVLMLISISLAELILKFVFKKDLSEEELSFGKVDLDHYLKELTTSAATNGEIEHEIKIFQNALDFADVKARECMVPRTDIVALDIEASVEELKQQFIQTGLSKILIYRDSIDNIIGYAHSFEIFKKPENIKSILLPVTIIPETMAANEVLEMFIKNQRNIAIVVDEFGGTSGMLTIEDVMEEIFGEIEDEHDKVGFVENKINEKEYEFSARLEIDYINEKFGLALPESDEYETLGGLIMNIHESIPNEDETISFPPWVFEIKQVAENRIETVKLKLIVVKE